MRGRKPKTDNVVHIMGNPSMHTRRTDIPKPVNGEVSSPDYLDETAQSYFDILVTHLENENRISVTHIEIITLTALALAEVERCTRIINTKGITYETVNMAGGKIIRARPEVGQRNSSARHAQALLAELGLSPTAAMRVSADPKSKKKTSDDFFKSTTGS